MPGGWLPRIVLLTLIAGAAPVVSPAAESEPIRCRQNEFVIPFRIHRQATDADAPVEVQLYCAAPDGQPWFLAQRAKPDAGGFKFRAPADGEYQFCLRVQDRQGRIAPAEPYRAELRVAVDTLAPRLEIKAQRGAAGELKVAWQASDKQLRPDSLRIEYQAVSEPTGPEQPWRMLAISPEGAGVPRDSLTGEAIWWPEDRAAAIALRAEIVDLAGNRTVTQARVDRGAASRGDSTATTRPQPKPSIDPAVSPRVTAREVSQSRGANGSFADGLTTDDALDGGDWKTSEPNRPRELAGAAPTNPAQPQAPTTDSSTWQPAPLADPQTWLPDQTSATTLWREAAPAPAASNSSAAASQPPPVQQASAARPLAPTGAKYVVASTTFALAYPSQGRPGAELWGTVDGGRTWSLFAVDRDAASPLDAQVARPGSYGFRIVVPTATGLSAPAPRSGQSPDFWVEVAK